jgi:murein DD-endopeptidase MepM/ murein hydrolase activator NlpD
VTLRRGIGAALLALAACSAAPPAPAPAPATDEPGIGAAPEPVVEEAPPIPAEPEAPARVPLAEACNGTLQQGGLVVCRGAPGEAFRFGDVILTADETGAVQYGLARNAPARVIVESGGETFALPIAPRSDPSRTVPGLDCDKVDARTPAQKAHAADSWEKKQASFNAFMDGRGALDGFSAPSTRPPSSPFGPERRYTGVSKTSGKPCDSISVHQGLDFAAPLGSPVTAPAAGTVTLADADLYYEGGSVFIDHGQGLLSVFMHLSDVTVAAGDVVAPGELIARSGNTGRSSGPHLHWGVKWRNPASTDRSGDTYLDPALLLDLPGTDLQ